MKCLLIGKNEIENQIIYWALTGSIIIHGSIKHLPEIFLLVFIVQKVVIVFVLNDYTLGCIVSQKGNFSPKLLLIMPIEPQLISQIIVGAISWSMALHLNRHCLWCTHFLTLLFFIYIFEQQLRNLMSHWYRVQLL